MSTGSDNYQRRGDVTFTHSGSGALPRFKCGQCGQPSLPDGCGVRRAHGLRQKVCRSCKEAIDARKAATA